VPWEGEPRKLSKRKAIMKPGRVGWSLTLGSRRLRLHQRNHRHFLCKNSPALPPCGLFISPTGLAFGPVGPFCDRSILGSIPSYKTAAQFHRMS
jgi:hypothetical protein